MGFCTVALTVPSGGQGSVALNNVAQVTRTALVLGSEGTGLSAAVQQACSVRTHIPMQLSAGVDSLNVSVAAAIACYALFGT